jgi:hypothetical protein
MSKARAERAYHEIFAIKIIIAKAKSFVCLKEKWTMDDVVLSHRLKKGL